MNKYKQLSKIWANGFDKHIETGYLDARDGFDRTTWWLFKK